MEATKVNYKNVISYGGAIIALLIGSGFATGQELLQYFSAYGYLGLLGTGLVFLLLLLICRALIYAGKVGGLDNPNDVYTYFAGDILGKFFDYFSVFFLFLSYTVMVAGAQATAVEHYNLGAYIGGIILALMAITTVVFGLDKIVEIIGSIGPVIVVLAIVVGLISIFQNLESFSVAPDNLQAAIDSGKMNIASSNFFFAALSYVGFCLIWLAAFTARLGKNAQSLKEGYAGVLAGTLGFSLACLIMGAAIYLSIDKVFDSEIPTLILAGEINPLLASVFSIVIFLGIYTTSVPLLWNVVARFAKEKTQKYRLLTIVLGVIGAIIGLSIDFSQLVNVVYVLNGYIGAVLMVIILYKSFKGSN